MSDLCVVDMTDFSEEWQCLFKTAQHPPLCHLSEDELFAHVAKPLIERMRVASNDQNVDHGIEQASVTLLGALFKERGHGDFVTSGLDVHRSPVVVKLFPEIRPKANKKKKCRLVPVGDDVVDFLAPYLCAPAPSPAAQPEAESPDFLEQLLTELIDEYNSDTEEQALVQVEQQEWDEAAQSDGEAVGSEADDVEAAQKAPDGAEAAQETPDVGLTPTVAEEDMSEKFVDNYEDMLISLGIEDVGYGF